MKFDECIDLAIAAAKIKPEKGEEAKAAYKSAFESRRRAGLSERAADDEAALLAVENLTKGATSAKWRKIHDIRAAADHFDAVSKSEDPTRYMQLLHAKLEFARDRVIQQVGTRIANTVTKFGARFRGAPTGDLVDVVRAMDSEVSPQAKMYYDELLDAHDWMRKRANMEGANLHANPKRTLPLEEDGAMLRQVERRMGDKVAAKAAYISKHLTRMDWDVVEVNGKLVDEVDREGFLDELYDAIVSDGRSRITPNHRSGGNIARRLSRPDFFYFKTSADWLETQREYGSGNVFEQLMGTINSRARDIVLIEHFGSNPTEMIQFVKNLVIKRAEVLDKANPSTKANMQGRIETELGRFDNAMIIFNGEVVKARTVAAHLIQNSRTFVGSTLLTRAFVPNFFSDIFNAHYAGRFYHMPTTGVLSNMLRTFAKQPSADFRKLMLESGYGLESGTTVMYGAHRQMGAMEGTRAMKWLADKSFRFTWLTPWTQAIRHNAGIMLSTAFAKVRNLPFDQVPWARDMRDFGITPEDWDLYRATPLFETPWKTKLLRPVDAMDRMDLDLIARQHLADKFHDFSLSVGSRIALESGGRVHAVFGGAQDPNTLGGMTMEMVSLIKTFPALMWMVHLKDAILMPGASSGQKAAQIGKFVVAMTMAGAFIVQARSTLDGNDFMDMNPMNPEGRKFWIKSFLAGGALGYLGDAIFGILGDYQHGGIADVMMGPQAQFFDKLFKIGKDHTDFFATWMEQGQDAAVRKYRGGADLAAFALRFNYVPWQFKLLFNRIIGDELLRHADPAAYNRLRQKQNVREREGQGSWWGVGEDRPTRPPDFGSAFQLGAP